MSGAKKIGRRLRRERESAGLSRKTVAEEMCLQPEEVTRWEAGSRSVSPSELLRLYELYSHDESDILCHGMEVEDEGLLAAILEENIAVEEICLHVILCREGVKLRRILGTDAQPMGPPWYPAPAPQDYIDALAQGEQVAEQERGRLGLGGEPVTDLRKLITSQGIWVSEVEFPDEVRGLFLNCRSTGLVIIVNCLHNRHRKRFSYASLYAHTLVDRSIKFFTRRGESSELLEHRADALASAFLMPKNSVIDEWSSIPKKIKYNNNPNIAKRFDVSTVAARHRVSNIKGLVNAKPKFIANKKTSVNSRQEIILEVSPTFESQNADQWHSDLVQEIENLALDAYRCKEISRGRLKELRELSKLHSFDRA